jgi:serine phosphatase RsbU (regulator of sigma subunit)
VILFSDGVTEARRGAELFGERRIIEVLRPLSGRTAHALAGRLRDAALEHAGRLTDDVQILAFRLTGPLRQQGLPLSQGG